MGATSTQGTGHGDSKGLWKSANNSGCFCKQNAETPTTTPVKSRCSINVRVGNSITVRTGSSIGVQVC